MMPYRQGVKEKREKEKEGWRADLLKGL